MNHDTVVGKLIAYLDSLGIKFQAFLLVGEELLNILALIALELDHLPHLSVDDDGAIASCSTLLAVLHSFRHLEWVHTKFLLDDLEDFLLVELLGKTLNSRQSLTTIALCK